MDWQMAEDRGMQFAFVRKNLFTWQDPLFQENFASLRLTAITPCVYMTWNPYYNTQTQLEAFKKDLDPGQIYRVGIDIEKWHSLNKQAVVNQMMIVLNEVTAWHGKKPLIYTAAAVWNACYSNKTGWGDDWDLWVASYCRRSPLLPIGWTDWTLWQFAADGDRVGLAYGAKSLSLDLDFAKDF
jgi:GH25 family lysozyme M1 (1,4-beta-N-acetylmuramidase)